MKGGVIHDTGIGMIRQEIMTSDISSKAKLMYAYLSCFTNNDIPRNEIIAGDLMMTVREVEFYFNELCRYR